MSRRLKLDVPPLPVLIEGDARVQALKTIKAEPQRAEEFVSEISYLWHRAQDAFLDIGRLLIKAKNVLPHGEYVAAVEMELPFSARTAYQLREAARWAMNGPVPLERLPGAYSTIYLLSTLKPLLLQEAEKDGLIPKLSDQNPSRLHHLRNTWADGQRTRPLWVPINEFWHNPAGAETCRASRVAA